MAINSVVGGTWSRRYKATDAYDSSNLLNEIVRVVENALVFARTPGVHFLPLIPVMVELQIVSLNIKNETTHRLVQELAGLTGESQTEAVTKAVQERLAKIRDAKGEDRMTRLRAIAKDCAAHMREPYLSIEHGDFLYGPDGLPN